MIGIQPHRAHKAQIDDRLVQLGIEHLCQLLQNDCGIEIRWKIAVDITTHRVGASPGPTFAGFPTVLGSPQQALWTRVNRLERLLTYVSGPRDRPLTHTPRSKNPAARSRR